MTVHEERISKPRAGVEPNLAGYEACRRAFDWDAARRELDGLAGGGRNIAHEAVVRHARGPRGAHVAIRALGKDGSRRDLTYRDLDAATNRFANALRALGVRPGERVYTLLGRAPELHVAVLGALEGRLRGIAPVLRVRSGADPPASAPR